MFMVVTRRATLDDLDSLVDLRIEFLREAEQVRDDADTSQLQRTLLGYLRKHLAEGTFIAWLAQEGEEIVGTSGICFYSVPPTFGNPSGEVAYIMNMYTKPGWRRKGIGQTLLTKLLEEAAARGVRKVTLDTTSLGRPIFEKYGFRAKDNEMMLMLD